MKKLLFIFLFIHHLHIDVNAQYSINITPIDSNLFLYTSYGDVGNYKNIDANAAVVISGNDAIVFDTPWDAIQAEQLISYIRDSLKKNILLTIITHAHVDRIGSIEVFHKYGIPTYSYYLTGKEAPKHAHPTPKHFFYNNDTTFKSGSIDIVAYYPGAGHTIDNIVLYVPSKRFLYGGCFIKSGFSQNIGNIADADIIEWPSSVNRMKSRFREISLTVPGHGSWKSNNAIDNTLRLLIQTQESNY